MSISLIGLAILTVVMTIGVVCLVIATGSFRRAKALHQRSQQDVAAAEEKLRVFFDSAPVGIFESTTDGFLISANKTIATMLGYESPDDLIYHRNKLRKPLYVDPEVREKLVQALFEQGVIQDYECQWYRKDGSTIWLTGNGRVIPDANGGRHFEGLLYDISERKLAQEQLAQVKSQLEFVLNSATGVSIISTDVQGRIMIFNPGAEHMLGYRSAEMIGQTCDVLHHEPEVAEKQRDLASNLHRRVSRLDVFVGNARQGGHETREWTYVRKDGRHLTVSLTVTGIRNAQHELIGFLAIAIDITDQKRAEHERAGLEQQLRRKNLELERETRRAIAASKMKSEFLANMSHELRTPLNGIIGFTEMLHDEVIGPTPPEQKEYLTDILASARHLLQLINDILDLSKIEAGKMEFQPEDIDLEAVIQEVCGILKSLSEKKELRVETNVDPQCRLVHLDPRKLKQVLYNYLSNAIKFTPEGGTIHIQAVRETTETFRIEVKDTGIGIKEEALKDLFVEFQQLDSSAAKRYQGTGLGLALTKRIVEAQNGSVGVDSVEGEGSRFYAILPVGTDPHPALRADLSQGERPAILLPSGEVGPTASGLTGRVRASVVAGEKDE
jgi:PAS domain S-box-containing protein